MYFVPACTVIMDIENTSLIFLMIDGAQDIPGKLNLFQETSYLERI